MIIIKKLALIITLCITSLTVVQCSENNPQTSVTDITTTITKTVIELKNSVEQYYQPIKPYIYNPVGFFGACLITSVIGLRKIAAIILLGGIIAGSNEIIKYIEVAEKNNS